MLVRLYDETPQHRDNFRKIVSEGVLDSTLFHRVINQFMIQGGDPNSRDSIPDNDGLGEMDYTLPAEIDARFIHKRGALAAARQGDHVNPERRSNGCQFYIVHGRAWTPQELDGYELRAQATNPDFAFTPEQRAVYLSEGGAPHLDGAYTVFGELLEGFDVLDKIAYTPTTGRYSRLPNRPLSDIRMTVRPVFDDAP